MPNSYVLAALDAAAAAGALIKTRYRSGFRIDYKADASPVTEVDIAAEQAIRRVLCRYFPEHGFYGEELGRQRADADFLWLIDPLDGTKAFVRGYPLFSVQIALLQAGRIVAAVSHAPCWTGDACSASMAGDQNSRSAGSTGETIWAEAGSGAWRLARIDADPAAGQRLSCATTDRLDRTIASTGNLASLARGPGWAKLGALIPQLHRIRGYGDFLHYHWLADGRIDAVIESDVNVLDIAALSLIVREAGGVFTDLSGAPVQLTTCSVLAATPALHPLLLAELAGGVP
ncbi:MAG: inositol-phosphate phosphatase [Gammaproteobacteria bacterium]|nr:inositol-phosphate phosphatase [Gammaproteobacteria bacterium]